MWMIRFVAIAVAGLSLAQAAPAGMLRVMTYNIHRSEGLDGVFDIERIASVINAANPGIVSLQELDQGNLRSGLNMFQLNRLAELTGMQGYFGKTINFQMGEYGNGVLVSPDLTIVHTMNHPMPNPAGGEARAVIEMGLAFNAGNPTLDFTFFATHFHHTEDDTNRFAQAGFVNDLVRDSTTPALLAGDLNARPSSRTYDRVREQWTDTSSLLTTGARRLTQIDYIMYRLPDQWEVIEGGRFIVNPTTEVASDHYPVLAVIRHVPEPHSIVVVAFAVMAAWRRRPRRNA